MIKHIVIWKLKDHAEGADKASNAKKMKTLLESCRGIVPGMVKLEVGIATPNLEANVDIGLYIEFVDKAALNDYQKHPTHLAVKPFIGAVSQERHVLDYEA